MLFWFIMIISAIILCLSFVIMILTDKTKDGRSRPRIHYKRESEGVSEYLCKICPADCESTKDKLKILGEMSYKKENYFLLEDCDGSFYLRKYETLGESSGITRYILRDLSGSVAKKLKKQEYLNRICMGIAGKSATKMNINAWDNIEMKVLINTYPIEYGIEDPVKAAFELENKTVSEFIADIAKAKAAENPINFYDIRGLGLFRSGSSSKDSQASWQECKRQIDYSLYVTHDWDIFKDENDR